MRILGWTAALLACLAAGWAMAAPSVRDRVESSLLVKGDIYLAADGSVLSHALDHADKLPPGVVDMVARAVPHWRFEPVVLDEGHTRARARMSVRVVASRLDDDHFRVEFRNAHFGQARESGDSVKIDGEMAPPLYPHLAAAAGVGGTVYLVLRIGPDGTVQDVATEQVNLRIVASEHALTRWRNLLGGAAMDRAKDWRFVVPTGGQQAGESSRVVRVPVDFVMGRGGLPEEFEWNTYVPGPRPLIPWVDPASRIRGDALAAGGVYSEQDALELLTPLSPPGPG